MSTTPGPWDPYFSAFRLLTRDLYRLLEYIEPTEANAKTYAHRVYELLLRVCTEFESVCKDMVLASGWNSKEREDLNVSDYRRLEEGFNLSRFTVILQLWKPPRVVVPFEAWGVTGDGRLPWWSDYNAVKHNRNSEFARANLARLGEAFAGLFLVLSRVDADGFEAGMILHGNHYHAENEEFRMVCDGKEDSVEIQ